MSSGLRKVVHLEVFDFDDSPFAYAVDSHKNQFGYNVQEEYYDQEKLIKEKQVNNVQRGAYYYKRFGINLSQMKSLKRKVREISKNKMIPLSSNDGIVITFRGGSDISYKGDQVDDFVVKVLKYKR